MDDDVEVWVTTNLGELRAALEVALEDVPGMAEAWNREQVLEAVLATLRELGWERQPLV